MTLITTTDEAIFSGDHAVHLPVLNIQVPFRGFFLAAPLLLWTLHFHTLFLLGRHTKQLNHLTEHCPGDWAAQLPASVFNALAGLRGPRYGFYLLVEWILVLWLPLLFLVATQFRVSAFRDLGLTSVHALVVLADVFLVLAMWRVPPPKTETADAAADGRKKRYRRLQVLPLLLFGVGFAGCNPGGLLLQKKYPALVHASLVGRLAAPWVGSLHLVRRSLLSGPVADRIGTRAADRRSRDFSYATLAEADMAGIDLSEAKLDYADLRHAKLQQAAMSKVDLFGADLRGADLRGANLQAADLTYADLSDADLSGADLSGALLKDAVLNRATLNGTVLIGADLTRAQLNQVVAVTAVFTKATLDQALLQQGKFVAASFAAASLVDADLSSAVCYGAYFYSTDLRGTVLNHAYLQSAYLGYVELAGTEMGGCYAKGMIFQPVGGKVTGDKLILDYPVNHSLGVDWDVLASAWRDQIPETTGAMLPRDIFDAAIQVAKQRAANQTPVVFEHKLSLEKAVAVVRDATPLSAEKKVIRILTTDIPNVFEPAKRRAKTFSREHAPWRVEVEGVPMLELAALAKADLEGPRRYHGYLIYPRQITELAKAGLLTDLTERMQQDTTLDYPDLLPPFVQSNSCYRDENGCARLFAMPLDGNIHVLFYRRDLINDAAVPRTWDDVVRVATQLNREKTDPSFAGCAVASADDGHSFHVFWSVIHPFLQANGRDQGSYFDGATMLPLVDNEAFQLGLRTYAAMLAQGPRDSQGQPRLDLGWREASQLFIEEKVGMMVGWPDVGGFESMHLHGKIGVAMLPGTTRILNRGSGALEAVNYQSAPYAFRWGERLVNHAPFLAGGGFSGVVRADARPVEQNQVYAFFSYMSRRRQSMLDVTYQNSGYNPYRLSHIYPSMAWKQAGLSPVFMGDFLAVMRDTLENPNLVYDLKIPRATEYLNDGFSQIIHPALTALVAGDEEAAGAVGRRYAAFMEQLTEAQGREQQRRFFLSSLDAEACPCQR